MGRVACLGQDVYKLTGCNLPLVNFQKARIDYLYDISNSPRLKANAIKVIPFINHYDIKNLILQQEIFGFFKKSPKLLYMDSYSELTDQRFLKKMHKWSFCANFSDISYTSTFKSEYESLGLLDVNNLLESYRNFFNLFRINYGPVPIIFIHFPVKLDNREKFKFRYIQIKKAIDILKNEFSPFYSLDVEEDIVDWPNESSIENKNFPYHYNQETYQYLSDLLRKIDIF